MSPTVAVMWAATWWAVAIAHRPRSRRDIEPIRSRSVGSHRPRPGRSITVRIGTRVQQLVPLLSSRDPGIIGAMVVAFPLVVMVLGFRATSVISAVVLGAGVAAGRSRRRRRGRVVQRNLVSVAELLAASLRSGLSTRLALSVVAAGHPRSDAVGLTETCRLIDRGISLRDALERWGSAVMPAGPLARLMIDAEHTGAPIADDLVAFAAQRRTDLRRDAEERARRLPVVILVPLVCCVLPAFVVVAVVPMVVTGASSIVFPS